MESTSSTAALSTVNTRWFRDLLEDRHISQRKLAKMLEVDPSAVSLMLRGMREIKMEEARDLARILGVPLAEVLTNVGLDLSHDPVGDSVPVTGWVDGLGGVHAGRAHGPVRAPAPPGASDGTVALRFQNDTLYDGWLAFYKPVDYVMPEAIGRLAVVEPFDGIGEKVVCILRHGYAPGEYKMVRMANGDSITGRIKSASLVTWLKQ